MGFPGLFPVEQETASMQVRASGEHQVSQRETWEVIHREILDYAQRQKVERGRKVKIDSTVIETDIHSQRTRKSGVKNGDIIPSECISDPLKAKRRIARPILRTSSLCKQEFPDRH